MQGITANYINASTVETDGIDVAVDWQLPASRAGQFGAHLTATHFLSYEIPCTGANGRGCVGAGGTQDVVGFFNYGHLRALHARDQAQRDPGLERGARTGSRCWVSTRRAMRPPAPVDARARSLGYTRDIDSWLTVDLQYAYAFSVGDTDAIFTLGSKNLFDEEAPGPTMALTSVSIPSITTPAASSGMPESS